MSVQCQVLLQSHRLPGRDRALDGVSRFQVEHRLLGRGVHARPASREEVEPSARFVTERAPEIADRPVAGRVAAEKRQIDGMSGHIRMGNAFFRKIRCSM